MKYENVSKIINAIFIVVVAYGVTVCAIAIYKQYF